jgi:hypothetical protein
MSVTYSECGCVEWGMDRIANCGLCEYIIVFHISNKWYDFPKKFVEYKM